MALLQVRELSKNYGQVVALDKVGFEVPAGSVFGILGPNGSGKTTLLGIVTGILKATSGSFSWFGEAHLESRHIGTLLETPNFYPYLTGAQNLAITASLRGCSPEGIAAILERVGLSEHPDLAFGKFSLGMRQRLAIGAALLGDPQVVIFDEPTNGLDPAGIADIRTLIQQIRNERKTAIVASHMLDEVEKVCTHVAVLKKGHLLAHGTLAEILRDRPVVEVASPQREALEQLLREHPDGLLVSSQGEFVRVTSNRDDCPALEPATLNRYCFEHGVALSHLQVRRSNLEARFLELTDA